MEQKFIATIVLVMKSVDLTTFPTLLISNFVV
jgi:hypothetical protein